MCIAFTPAHGWRVWLSQPSGWLLVGSFDNYTMASSMGALFRKVLG